MSQFVLDASVSLAWYVDDPIPAYARVVKDALEQGQRATVPGLWSLEMANGLYTANRVGKLTPGDVDRGAQQLELLARSVIEIELQSFSLREAFMAAKAFGLTAYDAVYLETARRKALPLATLDKALAAAAKKAGVERFQ